VDEGSPGRGDWINWKDFGKDFRRDWGDWERKEEEGGGCKALSHSPRGYSQLSDFYRPLRVSLIQVKHTTTYFFSFFIEQGRHRRAEKLL
jgi:hypothetical protein